MTQNVEPIGQRMPDLLKEGSVPAHQLHEPSGNHRHPSACKVHEQLETRMHSPAPGTNGREHSVVLGVFANQRFFTDPPHPRASSASLTGTAL